MNLTVRNVKVDTNIGGELKAPKEEMLKMQKLYHMLFKHECDCRGIKCDRKPKDMLSVYDYISRANVTYFIELDGEVVGTCMKVKETIYNLVIRPKFRRKGILKWLFNEKFEGETIRLQVRESNEVAMAAYEKLGFEVEEDWYTYFTMVREA